MNNSTTHDSIESLACKIEINRLKKLHSPFHWWVIVWQKTKKRTECVKCGVEATIENYEGECMGRKLT